MAKIVVEDGDTLIVFAKVRLSISDPSLSFPAVARGFRVVADAYEPTLILVPLAKPSKIGDLDFKSVEAT